MENTEDFQPFPLFRGRHRQTIFATLVAFEIPLVSKRHLIELGDGDQMALEISTPKSWLSHHPTVILVHGLCGSHNSHNLKRLSKRLMDRGMRVVRLNLRGCGSGKGHARKMYHSGSSADVLKALEYLNQKNPESPMTLVGYSLGGNIVLKLAGELKHRASELIKHVIAISPPADLKASSQMLGQFKNQIYERYFIAMLLADINYRRRCFSNLPPIQLPVTVSMYEFDECFLAPSIGYKNADEYYEACSARNFVEDIQIPCHVLFARDDPIIDSQALDHLKLPAHIHLLKTKGGGHLGFLGHPRLGFRWMDRTMMRWIELFYRKFYTTRSPLQQPETPTKLTGTDD